MKPIIIGQPHLYIKTDTSKESNKCPECGYHFSHKPCCSLIDLASAKEMLKVYHENWLQREKYKSELHEHYNHICKRLKIDIVFWQNKFNTIKHENNKLRKKLTK